MSRDRKPQWKVIIFKPKWLDIAIYVPSKISRPISDNVIKNQVAKRDICNIIGSRYFRNKMYALDFQEALKEVCIDSALNCDFKRDKNADKRQKSMLSSQLIDLTEKDYE